MAARPSWHRFDPSLLREYDLRGVYAQTLNEADAYALGRSFASYVLHERDSSAASPRPCIAIGRDGRISSPALEEALADGLVEGGVDVLDIGLGPSPMLYFAERSIEQVEGAIQVTGSHNPGDQNGFKIVFGGRPFFGARLRTLGEIALRGNWTRGAGRREVQDIVGRYVEALLHALADADPDALARLRIGWDTGNGAAGPVVERIVASLPGEHHLLFSTVDGRFPNHHPDPTLAENLADLQGLVAQKNLDFGVAFDGDGDRLGVVDGRGRIIWGDQLLGLFAADVLAHHPGAGVVGDVKMSAGVFAAIEAAGGQAIMAPSGHSHIKSRMQDTGALLGGEMSGHLFFADTWFGFDDALYAALRLIALTLRSGRSVTQMWEAVAQTCATPELRIAVPAGRRLEVVEEVAGRLQEAGREAITIDGVRVSGPDGWWLLRASNTQDMLTVRAEGHDAQALARLVAELDDQLALSGVVRPQV